MKTNDKFLIGIIVGIVLLIAIALVVTLARPEAIYESDDTPEGVAHNYLLALQNEDFEKAYGYLSPSLDDYPASADDFIQDIHDHPWSFRLNTKSTLSIALVETNGNTSTVTVNESNFRGGSLFEDSGNFQQFDMRLQKEANAWKISYSAYYFVWCWAAESGCD